MDTTSLSLLERAKGKLARAWDRLVALYQPLVHRYLRPRACRTTPPRS